MSYSQYSVRTKNLSHHGHSKDSHYGYLDHEQDNYYNSSQSGSFNSRMFPSSTTRKARRMGKVKTTQGPLRLSGSATLNFCEESPAKTKSPVPNDHYQCQSNSRLESYKEEEESEFVSCDYRMRSKSQPPIRTPGSKNSSACHLSLNQENTLSSTSQTMNPFSLNKKTHALQAQAPEVIIVNGRRFSILKKIGRGGSSIVYEVYDEDRELRAIKKVDLSDADEAQAQGYLNEIDMLEKLQGCHRIIKLYDYEYRQEENLLFVVMERGDTDLSTLLRKLSTQQKTITAVQRKFYWSEMLEAVQVIHNAGIIHSDLKPANFLIVSGTLKLIDFGIASAVQSDKTSVVKDTQMGTFNFMSPEAIQDLSTEDDGKPRIKISRKSDIWSLGCILYNLTYGKMPFQDIKKPIMKLQAITNPDHEIPFPEEGQDPELIHVLKRCLVRDPQCRASVEELLAHPYLKSDNFQQDSSPQKPVTDMVEVLSRLDNVLTPNTRRGISRAMQKLSTSDSSLFKLKHLDL